MRFWVISTANTLLEFVVVQSVCGFDVVPENSISKVQATGSSETCYSTQDRDRSFVSPYGVSMVT